MHADVGTQVAQQASMMHVEEARVEVESSDMDMIDLVWQKGEKSLENEVVLLNTEYVGDSILNGLSTYDFQCNDNVMDDEGDEDVNSDQSNKTRQVIVGTEEKENMFVPFGSLEHVTNEDNISGEKSLSEWEKFLQQPMKLYDQVVEYLAKWEGCHKLLDHEAWRKVSKGAGQMHAWLDVERNAVQEEERVHLKRKKKNKKGSGRRVSLSANAGTAQDMNGEGTFKTDRRKIHKIWSSKNRKPEKNLSTKKVTFRKYFCPKVLDKQTLGFSEFQVGSDNTGDKNKGVELTGTNRISVGEFYKEMADREARLLLTAGCELYWRNEVGFKGQYNNVMGNNRNQKKGKGKGAEIMEGTNSGSKQAGQECPEGVVKDHVSTTMENGKNNNLEGEHFGDVRKERMTNKRFLVVAGDIYYGNDQTSGNEELMEDMESETDGMAVFMKHEQPPKPSTQDLQMEESDHGTQV
ncbi:hypothetical protein L1987_85806 [Smallanthus sonchifolius]|uniref:Uncharacterized protein n=1 Tax=Smallanthus sonchifolius TaxID=185202 RepID=A0ACB8Y1Q8_9ASTR|nr:hypothetical protein L1987_85806 [Smallanthus sonchifolius]